MMFQEEGYATYIKREVTGLVVDIHGVFHRVDVFIKLARETTDHWVTFGGKRSWEVLLGK